MHDTHPCIEIYVLTYIYVHTQVYIYTYNYTLTPILSTYICYPLWDLNPETSHQTPPLQL